MAEWTVEAGDRLGELRARLVDRLSAGEAPSWTAGLGTRPDNPLDARQWATNAA